MKCRHCCIELSHTFLDLGFAPPSNAYRSVDDLSKAELYYPLRLKVCGSCWLVQTEDYTCARELFSAEYAYFSSISQSWLKHAACYSAMITDRLHLSSNSFVVEIASNDGYLLKNFLENKIPCLGIEPTAGTAQAAEAIGIPVLRDFFGFNLGSQLAKSGRQADLIIGNNVYAHVPDVNDFTAGLKILLKQGGVITLEFPHLMKLIEGVQFDTVYHEHFSYFSLRTVCEIFARFGLRIFDVEELSTHGGSLRVYGCHQDDIMIDTESVARIIDSERLAGLFILDTYLLFQEQVNFLKNNFLRFLLESKSEGKKIAAYGAAAKGNTLLNYAGVRGDLLPFICDAALSKQGKLLPGSHIPILATDVLKSLRPDLIIVCPWNLMHEITEQLSYVREWGGRFVRAVPTLEMW